MNLFVNQEGSFLEQLNNLSDDCKKNKIKYPHFKTKVIDFCESNKIYRNKYWMDEILKCLE